MIKKPRIDIGIIILVISIVIKWHLLNEKKKIIDYVGLESYSLDFRNLLHLTTNAVQNLQF